jgi:hypothetical protein
MRKLQITDIGDPADVLELVEFQAPATRPGPSARRGPGATINTSDFLHQGRR